MSNRWIQFVPIITVFLEEDDSLTLEQDWSSSLDTSCIEDGDSTMTVQEAEEVARRVDAWVDGQPIIVRIPPVH
jgi:hypothetical protein